MPSEASGGTLTERTPLLTHSSATPERVTAEPWGQGGTNEVPEAQSNSDFNNPSSIPNAVEDGYTTLHILRILSGVYIGAFLASLDSTLIITLMTPISASFDSLTLYSWLASAYFIANAASQPLAGKLSDIYGRKSGMLLCHILFGTGNLICGLARSSHLMVLGRIVAGLGGGGAAPVGVALISDIIPLRQRAIWQGVANVCFGIGSGLGGPVGGFINDKLGWRWAFFLQMPFTVIAITLTLAFQRTAISTEPMDQLRPRYKRIDFIGATLLVSTLVLLLLGLNSGGNVVPWNHPLILASLPLSVILLITFYVFEAKFATEPILPINLLHSRTIFSSCLSIWFVTAARFGLLFYAPVFFYSQGYSATATGAKLIPDSIAIGVSAILCAVIMRATGRYYALSLLAGSVFLTGMGLMVLFSFLSMNWLPYIAFALIGLGVNGIVTITLIAMLAAKEHKYQALITSMSYAFRSTGSTLGITLASVMFQNLFNSKLKDRLGDGKEVEELIILVRKDFTAIPRLPEQWRDVVSQSCIEALRVVFLTLFVLAAAGSIMLVFLKEYKLHKTVKRDDAEASQ